MSLLYVVVYTLDFIVRTRIFKTSEEAKKFMYKEVGETMAKVNLESVQGIESTDWSTKIIYKYGCIERWTIDISHIEA